MGKYGLHSMETALGLLGGRPLARRPVQREKQVVVDRAQTVVVDQTAVDRAVMLTRHRFAEYR